MHLPKWIFLLGAGMFLCISACQGQETGGPTTGGTTAQSGDELMQLGEQVYRTYCGTCHQPDGQGIPGAFPPLAETEWVQGDAGRLIRLVLNGMQGPVTINGKEYNNMMTPHNFLSDDQVAAVLTYVRSNFGNDAPGISPEAVTAIRAANTKQGMWTPSELEQATGIPE